jgi:hypothetical protein
MDGLIPKATAGNVSTASSNFTVTLSQYVTAKLKAYKSPIQVNTSRDRIANNKTMACALAEVAKYSPQLFANSLSITVAQSIFFSMGGPETALHAASTGHSAGLWSIGKRMLGVAGKAYSTVRNAISSLDPSTKAAISVLARGPEGVGALHRVKKMVGLSGVPDSTILQGAKAAERHLGSIYNTSDSIGAGFFGSLIKGIGMLEKAGRVAHTVGGLVNPGRHHRHAMTDASLYSGSDAPIHGAGFWQSLGKVATTALPFLLDDGTTVTKGSRFYAGDTSFPILNSDGTCAGKFDLNVSQTPAPLRTYVSSQDSNGGVHMDSRFESVKSGDSENAFQLVREWMKGHPEVRDVYVTIRQPTTNPLFGRSWEAALAANLAGRTDLITGKISHVDKGKASIGPIVGVAEKSRLPDLVVPKANMGEAPGNIAVSTINTL